jgi:hypothetical protein
MIKVLRFLYVLENNLYYENREKSLQHSEGKKWKVSQEE